MCSKVSGVGAATKREQQFSFVCTVQQQMEDNIFSAKSIHAVANTGSMYTCTAG
jgi:hypothetical protein